MNITDVKVIKSARKTAAIEITRTGEVIVRVPYSVKDKYIQSLLSSKREWIEMKLSDLKITGNREEGVERLTEDGIKKLAALAKEVLPQRIAHYAEVLDVKYGKITIRNQKTRWGSCSSKGNLNFNCLLMLCPDDVIDYVIVHELCHLLYLDHSTRFWNAVGRIVPDCKSKRDWLKKQGIAIMKRNPAYGK